MSYPNLGNWADRLRCPICDLPYVDPFPDLTEYADGYNLDPGPPEPDDAFELELPDLYPYAAPTESGTWVFGVGGKF